MPKPSWHVAIAKNVGGVLCICGIVSASWEGSFGDMGGSVGKSNCCAIANLRRIESGLWFQKPQPREVVVSQSTTWMSLRAFLSNLPHHERIYGFRRCVGKPRAHTRLVER